MSLLITVKGVRCLCGTLYAIPRKPTFRCWKCGAFIRREGDIMTAELDDKARQAVVNDELAVGIIEVKAIVIDGEYHYDESAEEHWRFITNEE